MSSFWLTPLRKLALPKIALLLLASAALLAACRKKGESSNLLTGTWELRQVTSNFPVRNYPSGNGHLLQFSANAYSIYAGGQLQKAGTYNVVPDGTVAASVCLVFPAGEYTSRIRYDNNDSLPKQFFQLAGDNLTIVSGCFAYDAGVESVYARVSN